MYFVSIIGASKLIEKSIFLGITVRVIHCKPSDATKRYEKTQKTKKKPKKKQKKTKKKKPKPSKIERTYKI